MNSIYKLISNFRESESVSGIAYKATQLQKLVLCHFIKHKKSTIAEIALATNMSIPKINEIIVSFVNEGIVLDLGKELNGVGRKPNFYGLNANAAYFLAVEVNRYSINIALVDFEEELIVFKGDIAYHLENNSLAYELLCTIIEDFLKDNKSYSADIIGLGLTITGRVNHNSGTSYSYFNFLNQSLSESLQTRTGIPSFIENDTRAMAYGEYFKGVVNKEKDVLFINLDDGIGMGIIIDGNLYSGKSGFAGEFGHLPILANDIICHCGKKGCLETEASGIAIAKQLKSAIQSGTSSILEENYAVEEIKLKHIVQAALKDDTLSIDLISKSGEKIGKGVALLLNLFNPDLVVFGGELSNSKSLILLPILSSINKHSLNLINTDTKFKFSMLDKRSGLLGVVLLLRNKILNISI